MRSPLIAAVVGLVAICAASGTALADTQFAVSQRIQVASGPLNARKSANVAATKYGTQPAGALGVLHQGPISQGGYDWWFVDYDSGPDGWSASSFLTTTISSSTQAQVAAAANSQIDALLSLVKNLQIIVAQLIAAQQK